MKRALGILSMLVVASSHLSGQPIPNATASATAVANPKDVASPTAIITAL